MIKPETNTLLKNISYNLKTGNDETTGRFGIEPNESNRAFFSIISHNIKNPFSTLLGFTDLVFEDFDELTDEERKFYLSEIKKSASVTFNYIEKFFEWIYYKTGKIKLDFTAVNVHNTIQEVAGKFKNEKNRINIEIEENLSVHADPDSFEKIFFNLIDNAIKFSEKNTQIKITAKRVNNNIEISVKDSGIGIKPEDMNKLFDISVNPASIGNTGNKGIGLGLILTKELVELNNGIIKVESTANKGSKFTVLLLENIP